MPPAHANWFIGLPVPSEGWFAQLPDLPPGSRPFSPGDLHITVAFLGAVGEAAARGAFARAHDWPSGPLPVQLGAVRPFGSKRNPSALSAVLCEGHDEVIAAVAEVRDELLVAAGARPEKRPPWPHVTLARIGRRARPEERRAALAWAQDLDLGSPSLLLDDVALYTWARDRSRALFRIVDRFEISSDSHPRTT